VDDLAGTGLGQVRLGLDAPTTSSGDDADEVDVLLGDNSEKVRIVGSRTAGVTVAGPAVPVLMSGAEKLEIAGGAGDDVIDASRFAADAPSLVMFGYSNRGPASHGHDTLIGSPGDDQMFSFDDGGDRTEGRGGNDDLVGSPDKDQLFGGDGDDFLSGLGGNDVLDGGAGNNVIIP
jgi:Ca2+-binding RTX toxin-like protein